LTFNDGMLKWFEDIPLDHLITSGFSFKKKEKKHKKRA